MSKLFKSIGKLFKQEDPPPPQVIYTPAPAAAPPTVEQAAATREAEKKEEKIESVNKLQEAERDAAVAAQEKKDAILKKKGRAAQILTGSAGAGLPKTAAKALLGE